MCVFRFIDSQTLSLNLEINHHIHIPGSRRKGENDALRIWHFFLVFCLFLLVCLFETGFLHVALESALELAL